MLSVCRAILAAAVVCAFVACGGLGGSDHAIVYVSEVDGNPDVYTVHPESGEASAVKSGPQSEFGPVWAPGGERIAFVTHGDGGRDVMVLSLEGDGGTMVLSPGGDGPSASSGKGNEGAPLWHPEGGQLAYVSDAAGHPDIYVSTLEDGNSTRVTSSEERELLGDWSPDGQWLVFSRPRAQSDGGSGEDGDKQGLWLRNPAGVNLLRLTEGADSEPVWSPDGDVIAFVRDDLGNRDIYLLRPEDGEDWRGKVAVERWQNSPEEEHSPAWAPNGDTLAFVSTRDGNPEIYVADTGEDAAPSRLTINEAADTAPVWSPDGNRIAFVTDLFGETEILVMDADGTNQKRLTHNDARDDSPDW